MLEVIGGKGGEKGPSTGLSMEFNTEIPDPRQPLPNIILKDILFGSLDIYFQEVDLLESAELNDAPKIPTLYLHILLIHQFRFPHEVIRRAAFPAQPESGPL